MQLRQQTLLQRTGAAIGTRPASLNGSTANGKLWRTPKPTATVIPRGKTSLTKRSSGPKVGVKRQKTEATGLISSSSSSRRSRNFLASANMTTFNERNTTANTHGRSKKKDFSLKRRSTTPKKDAGNFVRPLHTSRHYCSLMEAMQHPTLF